jgi:predicted RNA-binding protein with PIN domain
LKRYFRKARVTLCNAFLHGSSLTLRVTIFCFMLREVLIDGYNLLHAAGLARPSYGPGDLDRARRRLLVRIADLIDEPHRGLFTIVFDAKQPPADLPDRGEFKSMHIRYAQDHAEADDLIEELIRAHSTPKRLLVVSADQRLRQAAKRKGAHSITGEEFLDALEVEIDEPTPRRRATAGVSLVAMAEAAAPFADIDVDALRNEVESESRQAAAIDSAATQHGSRPANLDNPGSDPATSPQTAEESRIITSDDEVAFWNSRIAELLREEGRS